jgi:hypothetical protein
LPACLNLGPSQILALLPPAVLQRSAHLAQSLDLGLSQGRDVGKAGRQLRRALARRQRAHQAQPLVHSLDHRLLKYLRAQQHMLMACKAGASAVAAL